MSKCIRLAVFAFFAAFVFIMCGESHARPGLDGIDEHGRRVNVIDVDRYLKQNPYRPPAKKAPVKKPAVKKPAPKKTAPKPAPKKPAPQTITVHVPKKPAPKLPGGKFSKLDLDDVLGEAVVGGALGGIVSGGVGAGIGAATGAGHVVGKWAWNNKKEIAKEYKKISILEDPMGETFPH